ncbi:ankyrin repeat-containing domain protein [Aspergillus filifer]
MQTSGYSACMNQGTRAGAGSGTVAKVHTAYNGHTKPLKRLIEEVKEYATQADEVGTTALLWSSWAGQYEASKLLLSHGADVNAVSERYGTPLLVAALKGHDSVVQLLLDHGADIDYHCGKIGYAQYAVTLRYETNYVTSHVGTALWAASLSGHFDAAALFLQKGATGLNFALMSACRGGNPDVTEAFRFLIQRGASVNEGNPLLFATCNGHVEIVKLLVEKDADVDEDRPLLQAASRGYLRIAKLLAVNGADVDESFPMAEAARNGHVEVVKLLIDEAANVDGGFPLLEAARAGHSEIVSLLLKNGADVNGGYPLAAAESGHGKIVKQLIKAAADVDGDYPLHTAIRHDHLQIAV